MKRHCTLRHVPFESLGLLAPLLARHGFEGRIWDVPVEGVPAEAEDADLLIVLGGPIGVYEEAHYPFLVSELDLLRRRLAADLPTLGICLGAQLMARAAGGSVFPGHGKELGWTPLLLTEAGGRSALAALRDHAVLSWHGDTFALPPSATLLASTQAYPNQAFTVGRRGLGLQFHIEVTPTDFEGWLVGHAGEIAATAGVSVPDLRAETAHHAPRLLPAAESALSMWLSAL